MKATRRDVLALAARAALGAWPARAETASQPDDAPGGSNAADFDQVWELVRDRFYDPRLHGLDWEEEQARFRPQAIAARSREEAAVAINAMLAKLGASHTHYYTSDDPAYYQLADIFVGALEHRGLDRVFPKGEVAYPGIGVFTETDGQGRTFVTGVIDGAPAHAGRRSRRRRNPVGGRSSVPPGRLVSRQGRAPRLASDPPRARRGADRDQRHAGRSSPERDVPARPQGQRPRHRRRTRRASAMCTSGPMRAAGISPRSRS